MSVIDSLFPGYAAKRAMARLEKKRADLMLTAMERRFEGAAGGRRNQGWRAAGADANTENASALAVLRNRARDLRRNNPYAGGHTTAFHADPAQGVHTLQIEIDRGLYLEPMRLVRGRQFDAVAQAMCGLVEVLKQRAPELGMAPPLQDAAE